MMESAGVLTRLALQVLALFLFAAGAASLAALVKGCFVLRRLEQGSVPDDTDLLLKSPLIPAVSVIAAPPDVSPESREFVRRLLDLHFGKHEVVVVLDGPSDSELAAWIREFRLCPSSRTVAAAKGLLPTARIRGVYESADPSGLLVVDKESGGHADALNAGVNAAASPWVGLVDPESEFAPSLLLRLVRPMLAAPEEPVGVCAVAPAPPASGMAGLFGVLESLRCWLARSAAFAGWNMPVPVPGASMLVKREALIQAGGFKDGLLELSLRLHGLVPGAQNPCRILLVPEPVSHVRAPRSFADLRSLTARDQAEIAQTLGQTKAPPALKWGLAGLFVVRFIRPLAETAAYLLTAAGLWMRWVDPPLAALVLLSTVAMGMVISMAAVALRELAGSGGSDPFRLAGLFFAAIPENLGYRQVRNLRLIWGFWKRTAPKKQSRGSLAQGRQPAASSAANKK